jgi:nicotinate-nucleotide pyrophosphorylase (carboxylating)
MEHLGERFGFGPAEQACAERLIELAMAEDLGERGDITARAVIPATAEGAGRMVARAGGVLSGMPVVAALASWFSGRIVLEDCLGDGATVVPGMTLARVSGLVRSLLAFERTALNFLQRLSGIATLTARYVEAVRGTRAVILDTRKTTPGWRALEKYAVRCGGGRNHRLGLYDAVLIKDNHLAWLAGSGDPIPNAVAAARAAVPPGTIIEIEVDGLDQLDEALRCRPDVVLLDNFPIALLAEAVRRRDRLAPGVLLEVSGGVVLESVWSIASSGVDRISVGALTHSAPALDVALDLL